LTVGESEVHFCPWFSYTKEPIVVAADFARFEARISLSKNRLYAGWITEQEVNATHFEVQISVQAEPVDFETVATVPARGAVAGRRYGRIVRFPIGEIEAGDVRYCRIKCSDDQHSYVYSDVRDFWFDE